MKRTRGPIRRYRSGLGIAVLATSLVVLASDVPTRASPVVGAAAPVPLAGDEGQALLRRSKAQVDFTPLVQEFLTQANLAYCGVASAVMALNSLAVPAPPAAGYGRYRFWTQDNLFQPATEPFVRPNRVAREGMTLEQLAGLLERNGLKVQWWTADRFDVASLRGLLRRSLADPGDRLLVNYDRPLLGQAGGGHISPLAAYDAGSDRVLILDVARYRYPSVWVRLEDLLRAMRSVDSTSGRSRGLVRVSAPPASGEPPPSGTVRPPGPS
ncbi:phytochelatin synthase family protein [Cyanobium sp. FGCU-6]|nr:phytochelatin synthase family protein [Cyanobium sp. FGCU6]